MEEQKKPDTKINSHSDSSNGGNMYDPWLMKWLCIKACESEFDNPRRIVSDSDDLENIPSVASLIYTNWAGTENWDDEE